MPDDRKDDYYRPPGVLWVVMIPFGLLLVTMAAFTPGYIPYSYLGPIGRLTKLLVVKAPKLLKATSVMAWLLHIGEALYAVHLCRSKNLNEAVTKKWAIQTFIYGVTSLKYLLVYKSKEKTS